jgi:hypothetical protein
MRKTILTCVAMLVAGCTAPYREPVLPAAHPASPDAQAAALESSRTLAISEPAASPNAPDAAQHGGHGAPSSQRPENDRGAAPTALYACPMHPEVTSDKPGQRCPKCGMKLVKKEGKEQP